MCCLYVQMANQLGQTRLITGILTVAHPGLNPNDPGVT
jgi:hypothetical protein